MSSFLNAGKRAKVRKEKKLVKKHMSAMYRILGEVTEIAQDMHNAKEDWNEENIVEIAAKYTDIELADMEKFLLLGKLQTLKDGVETDNSK